MPQLYPVTLIIFLPWLHNHDLQCVFVYVKCFCAHSKHVSGLLNMYHGMFIQGSCKQEKKKGAKSFTHWFSHSDDSKELHYTGVSELSIDGCLLQKLDSVIFIRPPFQCLYSNFHSTSRRLPYPLVHCPKLARTKMLRYPEEIHQKKSNLVIPVYCKSVVCKTTHIHPVDDGSIQSKRQHSYFPNSSW